MIKKRFLEGEEESPITRMQNAFLRKSCAGGGKEGGFCYEISTRVFMHLGKRNRMHIAVQKFQEEKKKNVGYKREGGEGIVPSRTSKKQKMAQVILLKNGAQEWKTDRLTFAGEE